MCVWPACSMLMRSPRSVSHTHILWVSYPLNSRRPEDEKATAVAAERGGGRSSDRSSLPVRTSKRRHSESSHAVAKALPSGKKSRALTSARWPSNVRTMPAVRLSHMCTSALVPPVRSVCGSVGDICRHSTSPCFASSVDTTWSRWTSHCITVPSPDAVHSSWSLAKRHVLI